MGTGGFFLKSRQKISIIFKCIMALIIIMGILFSIGIMEDKLRFHMIYSFTNLSNFYILVITMISIYKLNRKENISGGLYRGRVLGLIIILLTGLVYHFILLPQRILENPNYQLSVGNIITHYVTPVLMLLDWILFDNKGKMKRIDPAIIISFPIIYFIICSLYGYLGLPIPNKNSSYIYFFMDFNLLGVLGVVRWCVLIILCLIILVYLIYFLDYFLGNRKYKER